MRRTSLGTFRGNKAHSNMWQGYRLHHFEQFFQYRNDIEGEGVPVFEDTWAYRNREQGVYSYSEYHGQMRMQVETILFLVEPFCSLCFYTIPNIVQIRCHLPQMDRRTLF